MTNNNDLSLYNITEELSAFGELLEMDQGEITEESEVLLQSIEHTLATKTDGVVGYIQKEEDLAKLADERIKQLQDFKKSKKNKVQRFKEYVKECLARTNREKFEGTLNSIKLRKPTKIVKIINEDDVDPYYLISETVITIDIAKMKEDFKRGALVKGAEYVDGKAKIIIGLSKGK